MLGSIAAKQLGVSRSAVSHRLADLESQLGVMLVHTILTDDAEALVGSMGDALDRIEGAIEPIRRRRGQLRITSIATFVSHWLIPRLPTFNEQHARIEVSLSTTRRPINLNVEDVDCAIRHGLGEWSDLDSVLLSRETLVPVSGIAAEPDLNGPTIIRALARGFEIGRLGGLRVAEAAGRTMADSL